ncbi:MAG TPA: isocitrate/isopropylmalate dehydrogenase family protein [Aurantimonas coralicida]|uniref:Isocitrate/isopropylmalate dehydrogenase family protein n=2 Tax=root TaxID=1 RepID=A0A9C9NE40_9HYPH|nr:isocitrate/isopropylmalate dehydrogenase family protein [Aurantimonas coralicida]HET99604.1 isocitrate/isopropylmalate dehydrogenase family protein [Aurantimonas coralicida]
MRPYNLMVMEGDGIGPEIVESTLAVLRHAASLHRIELAFDDETVGLAALEAFGSTFRNESCERARGADGLILGPVSHNAYPPVDKGGVNPSGTLRKQLDLYANIRPARTRTGIMPRVGAPIDLVIVRENTEGFYADRTMFLGGGEFMPTPDLALAVRKVTRQASLRIAEKAFAIAAGRPRKLVTAVHKANVLRVSDGLFLDCVREVAARYPDIRYEEQLVDAMAAHLVRDASRFDVVVTTNMFGDILSDLASELAGSLGLAASLNLGDGHAMAQAQHGSAPDIAGRGIANPASLIGSSAMLLGWLGERFSDNAPLQAAAAIDAALDATIADPETRTADLGGTCTTAAFTQSLIARMSEAARADR